MSGIRRHRRDYGSIENGPAGFDAPRTDFEWSRMRQNPRDVSGGKSAAQKGLHPRLGRALFRNACHRSCIVITDSLSSVMLHSGGTPLIRRPDHIGVVFTFCHLPFIVFFIFGFCRIGIHDDDGGAPDELDRFVIYWSNCTFKPKPSPSTKVPTPLHTTGPIDECFEHVRVFR